MFFLEAVDICTEDYAPIWNLVGFVVNVIRIGIPIILIIFGMIDMAKAVISGKEDEQKKAAKAFGKRFLYAVAVFATVWIVTLAFDIAAGTLGKNNDDYKYDESSWKRCWALINGKSVASTNTKTNANYKSNENSKSEDVAVSACYACGTRNLTFKWGDFSNSRDCSKKSEYTDEESCLKNNK